MPRADGLGAITRAEQHLVPATLPRAASALCIPALQHPWSPVPAPSHPQTRGIHGGVSPPLISSPKSYSGSCFQTLHLSVLAELLLNPFLQIHF